MHHHQRFWYDNKTRVTGRVLSYWPDKGYGFIHYKHISEDGSVEYGDAFFLKTSLRPSDYDLKVGEGVKFTRCLDNNTEAKYKIKAIDIFPISLEEKIKHMDTNELIQRRLQDLRTREQRRK